MMAVPYFAAFDVTRAFIEGMLKRNSGHIVNMSSAASRFVWPGAAAYTAARWAMRGFTEALRSDLHGTGIGVTLYESTQVESQYWEVNPGSRERIPRIGRLLLRTLRPEEVGEPPSGSAVASRSTAGSKRGNPEINPASGHCRAACPPGRA